MSKCCEITGKAVLYGNNVSHANNKSSRRFMPNLQNVSFISDSLGRKVSFRCSAAAVRTVEKNGGIDKYLLLAKDSQLSKKALALKKVLRKGSIAK